VGSSGISSNFLIQRKIMGRSNETSSKKEVRKKQEKNRKDKEKKRLERKASSRDGKNLDDMIAYVDEFGNLSSVPPDLTKRAVINAEDIDISGYKSKEVDPAESIRNGIVTYFNDSKGYGFLRDTATRESVFVHINVLTEPLAEGNKVTFEVEKGPKGLTAINVKKLTGQSE